PWMVWHVMHSLAGLANSLAPSSASESDGGTGKVSFSAASQDAKSVGESTTPVKRMLACDVPQNSAHCPGHTPTESAVYQRWLVRVGMTPRLPPRRGIQNEWMMSAELRMKWTGRPCCRWTSLAVTMLYCG